MFTLGFRHWPLLIKLATAFSAIMVALLFADHRMEQQLDVVRDRVSVGLGEQAAPGLETMSRLSYYVPLMRVHIYRYCFFTEPERRVKIDVELKNARKNIVTALADYGKTTTHASDKQQLGELGEKLDKYWWWVEETQKLINGGADNPTVQKFQAQYTPLYNEIEKLMIAMVQTNVASVKESVDATIGSVAQGRNTLRRAIAISAGISVAALLVLTLTIALPIRRIARDLTNLAAGRQVEVRTLRARHDEIGRAEQAAMQTSIYMNEMGTLARRMSEGDLTTAVHPRGADDAIGNAFANMLAQFKNSLQTISRNSQKLAQASRGLSSLSTDSASKTESAAQAADDVSTGIHSVATAASTMSHSVRDISAQTSAISAKVAQTSQAAEAMTEAARRADAVAEMIARIAQQTNILSLNAAVEAARAGDQGRGFAVVASEVNNLAKQTSQATRSIAENLRELQQSAHVVAAGTQEVRSAADSVARTLQAQSESTLAIDDSLRKATLDSQGIAQAMGGVRKGASDVHQAANELATIAESLKDTVDTFRV